MTLPLYPPIVIANSTCNVPVGVPMAYSEHELTYTPAERAWVCHYCKRINPIDVYECGGCTAPRMELDHGN